MAWKDTWTSDLWDTATSMFNSGEHWTAIAKVAGCSPDAVRRKFYRKGITNGMQGTRRSVSLWVDRSTYRALNESASARGKSVESLLADITKMLADPVLLENVLDDGVSI